MESSQPFKPTGLYFKFQLRSPIFQRYQILNVNFRGMSPRIFQFDGMSQPWKIRSIAVCFLNGNSCFSWPKPNVPVWEFYCSANYLHPVTVWLYEPINTNHTAACAFVCQRPSGCFKLPELKYSLPVLCVSVCVSTCPRILDHCVSEPAGECLKAKRPLGSTHSIPSSLAVTLL